MTINKAIQLMLSLTFQHRLHAKIHPPGDTISKWDS